MMNLENKTTIVTGAGTSIGREIALAFARGGARVICVGRRRELIEETARQIAQAGGEALAVRTDVTQARDVDELVRATLERFGQIDLLFNNHGSFASVAPVWQADPELWWRDVTINLFGTMLCCRAVLPHMMKRNAGVIINMEGGGGTSGPSVGGSGYGCSKAAVVRLTEGLARELEVASSDVLAFVMDPGFVPTDMTRHIATTEGGNRFQPFVRDWLAEGKGFAPDACAKATLRLLAVANKDLSGRAFGVTTDWDLVARTRSEIAHDNRYVLHLKK
jgi:NAD(P)-dependent dehydrogenase (short-subunit alcohol dehydrogenase family)